MSRRAALVGGAAAVLTGCQKVHRYNYRLTIEVEVDGVVHRGSAVRAAKHAEAIKAFGNLSADNFTTRGEAVVVNLGSAGYLFSGIGYGWTPAVGITDKDWYPDDVFARAGLKRRPGAEVELNKDEMPIFLWFGDLNAPDSVEVLDPRQKTRINGHMVSVRSMAVSITKKHVTTGNVQEILPWLDHYISNHLLLSGSPIYRKSDRAEAMIPAYVLSSGVK